MPDEYDSLEPMRRSISQWISDIGHFPLGLAAGFLVLALVFFIRGAVKRSNPEALDRYQKLLLILAGVVYLTNLILVSSLNATLDEMQIRAGIDPLALAGDLALIEYQKMVFHSVAVLALAGSGILLLLRRGGTS